MKWRKGWLFVWFDCVGMASVAVTAGKAVPLSGEGRRDGVEWRRRIDVAAVAA